MKLLLILCISLFTINISFAQVSILWEYPTNIPEEGQAICIDSANNIYTAGRYGTITKLNHFGDTIFSLKRYCYVVDMMIDNENNIIIVGNYNYSMNVQKFDDIGNLLWELMIDTVLGYEDQVNAMDIDENNNIYITGLSGEQHLNRKLYTAKISKNGVVQWENETVSGEDNDRTGKDIIVKDSNNVYSISSIDVTNNRISAILVKYNNLGVIVWSEEFSYHDWAGIWSGPLNTIGNKLTLDYFGNIYIIASGGSTSCVAKFNSSGTFLWANEIDPVTKKRYKDIITDSTGIYVTGTEKEYNTYGTIDRICVGKLSFSGNALWYHRLDVVPARGKYIAKHKDGIVLLGQSYQPLGFYRAFYTVRMDSIGNIDWAYENESIQTGQSGDEPYDLIVDESGGIYITGSGNGSTLSRSHTFKLYDCESINPSLKVVGNTLFANEIPGATYSWYDCIANTMLVQGLELYSYTPDTVSLYKVKISYSVCSKFSACLLSRPCDLTPSYSYSNNGNGNYSFTNNSTGIFNKYHWAFGDGTSSTAMNPDHTFTTNGNYSVVLAINDSAIYSCIDYYIDSFNVTEITNPLLCNSAFVMYSDTTTENIIIVNSSTGNSSTGNNLNYLWTFGDGNTSTQKLPSHTYATKGPFYLCLEIDDGTSCYDSYCDYIGVNGVVFSKQAGFTINVIEPFNTGLEYNYLAISEVEIYPNPTSYQLIIDTELEISKITICDITGKTVITTIQNTNIINIADLSNGMYFIKIIIEGKIITKRFIKQ